MRWTWHHGMCRCKPSSPIIGGITATPDLITAENLMSQDAQKRAVARAAFEYIKPRLRSDSVIGIGTGSTANYFIDELAAIKYDINATVASSEGSAKRLKA